ncbi:MAG: hypothetical protein R3B49_00435 [Phycisphaerales bacterium]
MFLQSISEVDDEEIQRAVGQHIGNLHAFMTREITRERMPVTDKYSAEVVAWLLLHIGMGYGVMSRSRSPGTGSTPWAPTSRTFSPGSSLARADLPAPVRSRAEAYLDNNATTRPASEVVEAPRAASRTTGRTLERAPTRAGAPSSPARRSPGCSASSQRGAGLHRVGTESIDPAIRGSLGASARS